uniref:Uncharacterized protein n=1 Tax=Anguilla anguilla TaxID=7936 RepID=A0A0E9VGR4_ANGAN
MYVMPLLDCWSQLALSVFGFGLWRLSLY